MKLTETEKKELIESLHVYENHDYPVLRTFYKPDMEFYDTIDEMHLVEVLQQIHQNQKFRELVESFTNKELEYETEQLAAYKKQFVMMQAKKTLTQGDQDHIQHCLRSIHAIECMISRYEHYQKILGEEK